MCLILFAWKTQEDYPLVLLANRDEFYDRPTTSAHFWEDDQQLLAGRDDQAGGSWLGITRSGRFAAVTNYRSPSFSNGSENSQLLSRGLLVTDYLRGSLNPQQFNSDIKTSLYAPYSLLTGTLDELVYYSNQSCEQQVLAPGIYSLSNHLLDSTWPKVVAGKQALSAALKQDADLQALFSILQDRSVAADDELPDTGIGIELERLLAPCFINSPTYGTCSSTCIRINSHGQVDFSEINYDSSGEPTHEGSFQFNIVPDTKDRN